MESGEMLNNMNMAGTAIKPPRWKRKNFVESRRPSYAPPVLTDLGKKLAGLKKWHEEDEEEAKVEMTDRGEDTNTSHIKEKEEEEDEEEKEKVRKPKRKKGAKRRVLDEEPEEKEEAAEEEEKEDKQEKKQSKKPRMH